MAYQRTITQGDIAPPVLESLLDENGNPLNLQGMSVIFKMVDFYTNEVYLSAGATILQNDNNADTWGQVGYFWQAGDTATSGLYVSWWIVNTGAGTQHYPPDRSSLISIEPSA